MVHLEKNRTMWGIQVSDSTLMCIVLAILIPEQHNVAYVVNLSPMCVAI